MDSLNPTDQLQGRAHNNSIQRTAIRSAFVHGIVSIFALGVTTCSIGSVSRDSDVLEASAQVVEVCVR